MSQDLTTYVETDPGSLLTVISNRVTWTAWNETPATYVYKDMGVGHFAGNFIHTLNVKITARVEGTGVTECNPWTLANEINDMDGGSGLLDSPHADCLSLLLYPQVGGFGFEIHEGDSVDNYDYSAYTYTDVGGNKYVVGTDYYLTIRRDESVGTYGTLYLDVYSNSARTTLLKSISLALHTAKKDFRYIYAFNSSAQGPAAETWSGFAEGLFISTVYPIDPVTRVTGLIHRYDRRKGIYQLEMSFGDVTSVMVLPYGKPKRATAIKQEEQDEVPVKKVVEEYYKGQARQERLRKALEIPLYEPSPVTYGTKIPLYEPPPGLPSTKETPPSKPKSPPRPMTE